MTIFLIFLYYFAIYKIKKETAKKCGTQKSHRTADMLRPMGFSALKKLRLFKKSIDFLNSLFEFILRQTLSLKHSIYALECSVLFKQPL